MNTLVVNVSPRKKVYVKFTDDTAPNKGGYYCEVFEDEGCEFKYDEFAIQGRELRSATDKHKLACSIATNKVKNIFGVF